MTRNMNNLFRMSSLIRNLTAMSNHATSMRLFRTSSYCKIMWEGEHAARPRAPEDRLIFSTAEKYFRMITNKLRDCKNNSEVFEIVRESQKQMSAHEALKALSTLFRLDKNNAKTDKSIPQKKEFSLLCDILKTNVRQLNEREAIQALKVLNYFHVPTSTVIVQMLLQIIRHSVNDLSLEQIIFLDFLLTKCQKTPLVHALSIALPVVLQSKIKTQLDTENLDSLINILQYVGQNNESTPTVLNAINKFDDTAITSKRAKDLMLILLDAKINDSNKNLLTKIQQILTKSMEDINPRDISNIIFKISKRHVLSHKVFYHEGLIDACAMAVVSKDMGFTTAINVLGNLNILCHTNNSLLDYIAAKCFEDRSLLANTEPGILQNIIVGISIADYKPVFWDTLRESLMTETLLNNDCSVLIKTGMYLASLDYFWPTLLAKIFTEADTRLNIPSRKGLVMLYNIVKTMYPEYNGPWPSEELLEACDTIPILGKSVYVLKSALECALGGSQYVITNMRTSIGYYIDHVVIMRKGGFPVAINNIDEPVATKIEDLKAPQDSQVILFVLIPRYGCARNTQRLIGFWSLLIKTLKTMTNHTVIPISFTMWSNLSEAEQLRYISQAIRLKCDELSAIVNS